MGNLRYKLSSIFKKWKEEESKKAVNSYQYYGSSSYKKTIFFYEWSDLRRQPLRFASSYCFENFLKENGLELNQTNKILVTSLEISYVTCKHMSKDIIVRASYKDLENLCDENKICIGKGMGYVSCT